ncbi:stage 0 sporulation family protein [Chloroflexota bacterium]
MTNIVGIRFKQTGKIYHFDPNGFELEIDDCVVVNTTRGVELGYVATAIEEVSDEEVQHNLKTVVRKAEPEDIKRAEEFKKKEETALEECNDMIVKLNLPMKLLSAEYNLDGSRLTFFFSAAERVDFRNLVRELSKYFKMRVELRQVGARDESKLLGGFGRCGCQLCCARFLTDFNPVSIRMAKDQGLSLNPMRISGICGRLLCCLGYEGELYKTMKAKMPKEGQQVSTPKGKAKVINNDFLKETVTVEMGDGSKEEMPLSDITSGKR